MAQSQPQRQPGRSRKVVYRVLEGCFLPPPPPPSWWVVVDERVQVGAPPLGLEQEWGKLKYSTKRAYGCGEHGQKIVDGLNLYVRLVKPTSITTSLYIDLSDDAVGGVQAEFGESDGPPIKIDGYELQAEGAVSTVNEEVIVFVVIFRFRRTKKRIYYIVYDSVDGSIVMVPAPPDPSCKLGCTPTPLAVLQDRSNGGAGYELIFNSQRLVSPQPGQGCNAYDYEYVLYRWTPGAARTGAASCNGGLWHMQRLQFPQGVDEYFVVESMFAVKGQVFFGDLAQGLLYCNLRTSDDSVLDSHFIPLPAEAPTEARWAKAMPEDMGTMNWFRTLSGSNGTISFICIDRSSAKHEDAKLILFTLDLHKKSWLKKKEVCAVEIWKILGFHKKGLPQTVPKCPLMMADGSLSVLLPNMMKKEEDPTADYFLNFELDKMRFNCAQCLDHCRYTTPITLSWDFFGSIDLPANLKPRRTIFL